MSIQENTMIDFDLADLADLPEFQLPPAGAYTLEGVIIETVEREKIGTVVVVKAKVISTDELKNEADTPVADGSILDWSFPLQLATEQATKFAQGGLKVFTKPLAQYYGVGKFSELVEKFPGTQFNAILTVRVKAGKDGAEDQKFSGVKAITIN